MNPATKAELLAALAESERQVSEAVAILSGQVSDAAWNQAFSRILELRKLQGELRDKISAIDLAN